MAIWWELAEHMGPANVKTKEEERKEKEKKIQELKNKGYSISEDTDDSRDIIVEKILENGKKQSTRIAYYEADEIEQDGYQGWSIPYDKKEILKVRDTFYANEVYKYCNIYVNDGKDYIYWQGNLIDITDTNWRDLEKNISMYYYKRELFQDDKIIASEFLPIIGAKVKEKMGSYYDVNGTYRLKNGNIIYAGYIVDEDFVNGWDATDKSGKFYIKSETRWLSDNKDKPKANVPYYISARKTKWKKDGLPFDKKYEKKLELDKKYLCKYNCFKHNGRTIEFLTPICLMDENWISRRGPKITKENAKKLLGIENKNLKEEKKMEEKEVNVIDIAELGASIGMEAKEQTLPNGKVVKSLVWDQENLLKAVNEVKHLSEEGKPVRITGAAPAWLVSALTHTVHPCPVGVYMPQIGKDVEIPGLAHGEANPEGEVAFKTTEKGDAILIEYNMDLPEGITTYDENNLSKVVVPEVAQGKAVYLSGRGPNYLTVAIAESYAHTNSSVSLFQPGVGYTCSITHSRSKKLGDLTKDPLGKEDVKEQLTSSKENKEVEQKEGPTRD